jgi:hypothetical protein
MTSYIEQYNAEVVAMEAANPGDKLQVLGSPVRAIQDLIDDNLNDPNSSSAYLDGLLAAQEIVRKVGFAG